MLQSVQLISRNPRGDVVLNELLGFLRFNEQVNGAPVPGSHATQRVLAFDADSQATGGEWRESARVAAAVG
jgi:hypothetical protein